MLPRALVVEDDLNTRKALRSIIEGEGFAVDAADDGELAIGYLDRQQYAVILIDIVLPKLSGAAVMEHLRATNPNVLERVIVVTGLDVAEVRKLFPTVGHALSKPILPARLRSMVRRWMPGIEESTGVSVA